MLVAATAALAQATSRPLMGRLVTRRRPPSLLLRPRSSATPRASPASRSRSALRWRSLIP